MTSCGPPAALYSLHTYRHCHYQRLHMEESANTVLFLMDFLFLFWTPVIHDKLKSDQF